MNQASRQSARGSQAASDSRSVASPPLLRESFQKDCVDGVHGSALVSPTWPVEARARKAGNQVHKMALCGAITGPRRPRRSLRRPGGVPRRSKSAPRRPQWVPRQATTAHSLPREAPRRSKRFQKRPKRAPSAHKRGKNRQIPLGKRTFPAYPPCVLLSGPGHAKRPPKSPQDDPSGPQEAPKTAPEGP